MIIWNDWRTVRGCRGKKLLADEPALKASIIRLIDTEKKSDINLKIVFNYRNEAENYLVYLIESIYPTQDQYEKGVKGILYFAERKDPESKVINQNLRISISAKLKSEGAYEALLVNENNEITEGSRSNIFFLRNETLDHCSGKYGSKWNYQKEYSGYLQGEQICR